MGVCVGVGVGVGWAEGVFFLDFFDFLDFLDFVEKKVTFFLQ